MIGRPTNVEEEEENNENNFKLKTICVVDAHAQTRDLKLRHRWNVFCAQSSKRYDKI